MSDHNGRKRGFPWRKWNNILHRDLGYLCVGLTVIYAISGIAVNHIRDWNPSYDIQIVEREFEPVPVTDRESMIEALTERLHLPLDYIDAFRPSPPVVEIFYDGFNVRADATAGIARLERTRERPVLFDMNFLHLNVPKGAWTWVADIYAFLLILLAITGMFVLRGRKGLTGRGKWWVSAGVILPVLFVVVVRYLP